MELLENSSCASLGSAITTRITTFRLCFLDDTDKEYVGDPNVPGGNLCFGYNTCDGQCGCLLARDRPK